MACNWKLHINSYEEAKRTFLAIRKSVAAGRRVVAVVCAPSPFLPQLARLAEGHKNIFIGAQDVFWENEGSYTGSIGPSLLAEIGVTYVIVGHSERRFSGDTDEMVNRKIKATLKAGLTPIVCVGERERDDHGVYLSFLRNQLHTALAAISAVDLAKIIIAYEPVWAIGKDALRPITPHDLHETAIFIRKTLAESYGTDAAFAVPVLYGGSVSASNAAEQLRSGVQGLLIGRASTKQEEITQIIRIATQES